MESVFYFIRHEVHGVFGYPKQALPPSARKRAIAAGEKLKKMGVEFDYTACSWQSRAVETLLCMMQGMGKMLPLNVSQAIGDGVSGKCSFTLTQIKKLKADAKAAKMDAESFMLQSPDYASQLSNRGREGGIYILDTVRENHGKVGAGASHGGSRMEVTIMYLMRRSPYFETPTEPPFLFDRGSIAKLVFDNDDQLKEITYYGNFSEEPLILQGSD